MRRKKSREKGLAPLPGRTWMVTGGSPARFKAQVATQMGASFEVPSGFSPPAASSLKKPKSPLRGI